MAGQSLYSLLDAVPELTEPESDSEDESETEHAKFSEWKLRMKAALERADVWDVVDPDGSRMDKGEVVDDATNVQLERKRRYAMDLLEIKLKFLIRDVSESDDPRDCWIALHNKFCPNSPATKSKLKTQASV